jgi:hypothetical protein
MRNFFPVEQRGNRKEEKLAAMGIFFFEMQRWGVVRHFDRPKSHTMTR